MAKLITIDVGGTTIKYGLWDETKKELSEKDSLKTPETIEEFYGIIKFIVDKYAYECEDLDGLGMSIPGAVDQKKGIIGGISALPYIHDFPIQKEIENITNLKTSMENDANCAALAEVAIGSAESLKDVVFIVIGTGVGGTIIVNKKIVHGSHLYGGELGMMLIDGKQLSLVGTAVHLAERYNQKHGTHYTGHQIMEMSDSGDQDARKESKIMYCSLAQAIYNVQFVTDPEAIIIGGGVSANPAFITNLNMTITKLMNSLGDIPILPRVKAAKFHNDSNLIGAAYNFYNNK